MKKRVVLEVVSFIGGLVRKPLQTNKMRPVSTILTISFLVPTKQCAFPVFFSGKKNMVYP